MLTFPVMVFIILFTAVLSAAVTQALPHVPKKWNAFKQRIRRRKNNKRNTIEARLEWLEGRAQIHDNQNKGFHNRLDALDEQLNNIAETLSTRDRNRKYNTRRDVREYLQELQNK